MTSCRFRDAIDDYLLGRLGHTEAIRFEEHYFNCRECFEELKIRTELLRVIKDKGGDIFTRQPDSRVETRAGSGIGAFLRFKPWWALAALAVVAGLAIFLVLRPQRPAPSPAFTLGGDNTVRGQALEPRFPLLEVGRVPDVFEWKPLSRSASYVLFLYEKDVIWSGKTGDSRLVPPEEVKRRLLPGRTYTWEVKAYSPQGALITASRPVRFRIAED